MNAAALVDRLHGVRQTGPDRWLARCSAHDDARASLSVRELDDGRLLLHCFAGCSVDEIVAALGMDLSDLFPDRVTDHHSPGVRRPFPAADVLRAVAFEALVVVTITGRATDGHQLSGEERERLVLAGSRLLAAVDAADLDSEGERLYRLTKASRTAGMELDREAAIYA
jgi:hypothetical protein